MSLPHSISNFPPSPTHTYTHTHTHTHHPSQQRPSFPSLLESLAAMVDRSVDDYDDDHAGDKPNLMSSYVLDRLREDPNRAYMIPTLQRDAVPDLVERQQQQRGEDGYLAPSLSKMDAIDEADEG